MPQVGDKHYAYTKKGRAQAEAAARQSGKKVSYRNPKKAHKARASRATKKAMR